MHCRRLILLTLIFFPISISAHETREPSTDVEVDSLNPNNISYMASFCRYHPRSGICHFVPNPAVKPVRPAGNGGTGSGTDETDNGGTSSPPYRLPPVQCGLKQWQALASDKFGWLNNTIINSAKGGSNVAKRFSISPAPDGSSSVRHHITKGVANITPPAFDSPVFYPKQNFCAVRLTFKFWQESNKWTGWDGKYISLMSGRGLAGAAYAYGSSPARGADGWGFVDNHSKPHRDASDTRHVGYVYSYNRANIGPANADRCKKIGDLCHGAMLQTRSFIKTGQWMTISLVAIINDANKENGQAILYVDGVPSTKNNVQWAKDQAESKGFWMRWRRMFGGDPEKMPPLMTMDEWFKDFEIAVVYK